MYSNVVYASVWKATNGLSESIELSEPRLKTPPCLTEPAGCPPQPAAASAATTATAMAPDRRRNLLVLPGCLCTRKLTLSHLYSRGLRAARRLARGLGTWPICAGGQSPGGHPVVAQPSTAAGSEHNAQISRYRLTRCLVA